MAKPFISYAPQRKKRAEWLAALLKALGFEEPILASGSETKGSRKKSKDELDRADCFLALVSPSQGPDGTATEQNRPASWIEQDVAVAVYREIPIALIWEKNMTHSPMLEDMAFASEEINFDDTEEILSKTPAIVAVARKILSFFDKAAGEGGYPFVSEKVHFIDQFKSEQEWWHLRTISLTARKRTECIDHAVDVGQDKSPGLSVKLADPEQDLKVVCKADPGRIDPVIVKNEDRELVYRVVFTPPLKPGETINYRHESHHPNIYPMTVKAIRERAKMPGAPPFMKDVYLGNCIDITRPIQEVTLEVEAPIALGLSSPLVRVYVMNTETEIEEESSRIGNPESKPRLWEVMNDEARELWNCRVTIPRPGIGYSYYLLVRPTK